ncbi:MAG: hypothetical protein J6N77_00530 [Lachnospiraceae bacterium]|nr:hypothetical protein [Lachnospiraceae bacterium]
MSEEMKKEIKDMELSLEEMEQVSGGGLLEDTVTRIVRGGYVQELSEILRTQGKAAAAARCCELIPDRCGLCAAAVTMVEAKYRKTTS